MKKVVMGLSGGMDSTTLLGYLLERVVDIGEVHCCWFNYGSKHNRWEEIAVKRIIEYYSQEVKANVKLIPIDLTSAFMLFQSDLLLTGGEIPEGHYNDENMRRTVVPGRNLILSSIMAGYAESVKANAIALGVHLGDHHIYPDCRKEFIKALDTAIYLSSDRKIEVFTPFIDKDKTEILDIGSYLDDPVPYEFTRTCYKDQELSCGKCGSCGERLEAFANLEMKDPILYE